MKREIIIVRLDIFKKIGIGHLARIKDLILEDKTRQYILIYRTDIFDIDILLGESFIETYNIGNEKDNIYWSKFSENYDVKVIQKFQQEDLLKTKECILEIARKDYLFNILIIDNYKINQFWINNFNSENKLCKINLMHIDDLNKNYKGIDIRISYLSKVNSIQLDNKKINASGIRFCPFKKDIVDHRKSLINNPKYLKKFERNKILLSFGFFDELCFSKKIIDIILNNSEIFIILIISKESESFFEINDKFQFNKRLEVIHYTRKIVDIYKNTDLSFGSYGLMSLEKAFLGIPQFNLAEAENQFFIKEILENNSMSKSLKSPKRVEGIIEKDSINTILNSHSDLLKRSVNMFGSGIVEWLNVIDLFQN